MKREIITITILSFVLILSCSKEDSVDNEDIFLAETTLSQNEKDDLLFLREEEKLARDVYLYSFDKYGTLIFKNIASSESSHMNSVLMILNTYNLEDPAFESRGIFKNTELQEIYNQLTILSDKSLLDALKVGNIIEDLDIRDLGLNEKRTEKSDLLNLYQLLKCGSRNHLRNFNSQLISNSGAYLPAYITLTEFENIINSTNEKCGLN